MVPVGYVGMLGDAGGVGENSLTFLYHTTMP